MFPGCTILEVRVQNQELVRRAEQARLQRQGTFRWAGEHLLAGLAHDLSILTYCLAMANALLRAAGEGLSTRYSG